MASALSGTDRRSFSLGRTALAIYAVLFYAFLYVPILLLVVLSFNDSQTIGLPFRQFTLRWYAQILGSSEMLVAIGNSIVLGILSALIATTLALMLALGFRHDIPMKGLLTKIVLLRGDDSHLVRVQERGTLYAYEILNFVDGRRTVGEITTSISGCSYRRARGSSVRSTTSARAPSACRGWSRAP